MKGLPPTRCRKANHEFIVGLATRFLQRNSRSLLLRSAAHSAQDSALLSLFSSSWRDTTVFKILHISSLQLRGGDRTYHKCRFHIAEQMVLTNLLLSKVMSPLLWQSWKSSETLKHSARVRILTLSIFKNTRKLFFATRFLRRNSRLLLLSSAAHPAPDSALLSLL